MPVPTSITDLTATAASNSPGGSENVFPDLDNYLRAHAGFIAQLRDGTAQTAAALVVASLTVTGNAGLTGGATVSTLTVTGNSALAGTLSVTGAASLASTLTVTGAASLASTLTVSGNAVLRGTNTDVNGYELGYKRLPQNQVSTDYTLVTGDSGKHVAMVAGAGTQITIPNATFAAGDAVTMVNLKATAITLVAGVATLNLAGSASTGNRTLAANGVATVLFVNANQALISGAGLS